MQTTTVDITAFLPVGAAQPAEPQLEMVTTFADVEPIVGLALMAAGLLLYAGTLCIRDRWWELGM